MGEFSRRTMLAGTAAGLAMPGAVFAADPAFLQDTLSTVALDALGRLVSAQFKAGAAPLGPREWGLFLEYAAARPAAP